MRKSLVALNVAEYAVMVIGYTVHAARTQIAVEEATDDMPKPIKVLDKIGYYVKGGLAGAGMMLLIGAQDVLIESKLNKVK